MEMKGTTALVAGGASGLGAATVRRLAVEGARIAILDHDGDRAKDVAAACAGLGLGCDVTDENAVAECIAQATAHFGSAPRIVVNCAGIAPAARVVGRDNRTAVDVFRRVIEVNLVGSFVVMSHAAKAMMDLPALEGGERGVIINTSSAAYEDGQIGQSAYAASKGGIASMCLPAARDLARSGIRVMAIAPGLFRTPMMAGLPDATVAAIAANIPFPDRLGEPDEFAHLVADIVANAYLNGTVIRLDGAVRLPQR